MKVLYFASWYPDNIRAGRGIFFKEQAEAMAARGHDVSVIVVDRRALSLRLSGLVKWKDALFQKPVREKQGRVSVYEINRYFWLPQRYFRWLLLPCLKRDSRRLFADYVKDNGLPDVIHAHAALHGGYIAARIARKHGIPFFWTEHRSNYLGSGLSRSAIRETQYCMDRAIKAIFVSERLKDSVLALLKRKDSSKCLIIGNIVKKDFFQVQPKHTQGDGFSFCTVGNLVAVKGQDLLLRAFAIAFRDRNGVRLSIGGEGKERSRLESLARELDLGDRVSFLGHLDRAQVRSLLASSDAFVFPSRHETFGIALAEAAAAGLPVVATDCGGPSSIVTERNGLLVAVDDVEALAKAMLSLVENRERYDASIIREECRGKYGEDSIIRQIEIAYAAKDLDDETRTRKGR